MVFLGLNVLVILVIIVKIVCPLLLPLVSLSQVHYYFLLRVVISQDPHKKYHYILLKSESHAVFVVNHENLKIDIDFKYS